MPKTRMSLRTLSMSHGSSNVPGHGPGTVTVTPLLCQSSPICFLCSNTNGAIPLGSTSCSSLCKLLGLNDDPGFNSFFASQAYCPSCQEQIHVIHELIQQLEWLKDKLSMVRSVIVQLILAAYDFDTGDECGQSQSGVQNQGVEEHCSVTGPGGDDAIFYQENILLPPAPAPPMFQIQAPGILVRQSEFTPAPEPLITAPIPEISDAVPQFQFFSDPVPPETLTFHYQIPEAPTFQPSTSQFVTTDADAMQFSTSDLPQSRKRRRSITNPLESDNELQFQDQQEQLSLSLLGQQQRKRMPNGSTSCPHCPTQFQTFRLVQKHIETAHPEIKELALSVAEVLTGDNSELAHTAEITLSDSEDSRYETEEAEICGDISMESQAVSAPDPLLRLSRPFRRRRPRGPTQCFKCPAKFCRNSLLRRHIEESHPEEAVALGGAGDKPRQIPFQIPNSAHKHGKKKYDCPCGSSYLSQQGLSRHICQFHLEELQNGNTDYALSKISNPDLLRLKCQICHSKFLNILLFQKHWETIHGNSTNNLNPEDPEAPVPVHFICSICHKPFPAESKNIEKVLSRHFYKEHRDRDRRPESPAPLSCSESEEGQGQEHENGQESQSQEETTTMLRLPSTSESRIQAKNPASAYNKKLFKCPCGNTYLSQQALNHHICKVHLEELQSGNTNYALSKPTPPDLLRVKCKICHSKFLNLRLFQKHWETIHSNSNSTNNPNPEESQSEVQVPVPPVHFLCSVCDKTFLAKRKNIEKSLSKHFNTEHRDDDRRPDSPISYRDTSSSESDGDEVGNVQEEEAILHLPPSSEPQPEFEIQEQNHNQNEFQELEQMHDYNDFYPMDLEPLAPNQIEEIEYEHGEGEEELDPSALAFVKIETSGEGDGLGIGDGSQFLQEL